DRIVEIRQAEADRVHLFHSEDTRVIRFIVVLAAVLHAPALSAQGAFEPVIPRVWDDASLADWATPVVGLNLRPTHISPREYYSLAVENRRTYPVYYPGHDRRVTGRCCGM